MTGYWWLKLTHVCWDPWIKSSSHSLYFQPNKSLWWKLPYSDTLGLENHIQGKATLLPQFPPVPAAGVPWSAQYTFPDPERSLVPSDEVLLPPWLSSPASSALGFQWTQTQKRPPEMKTGRRGASFLEGKRELVSISLCAKAGLFNNFIRNEQSLRTKGLTVVNNQDIWSHTSVLIMNRWRA